MRVTPLMTQYSATKSNNNKKQNNPAFGSIIEVEEEGLKYLSTYSKKELSSALKFLKEDYPHNNIKFTIKFKDTPLYRFFKSIMFPRVTVVKEELGRDGNILKSGQFKLTECPNDPEEQFTANNVKEYVEHAFDSKKDMSKFKADLRKKIIKNAELESASEARKTESELQETINEVTETEDYFKNQKEMKQFVNKLNKS